MTGTSANRRTKLNDGEYAAIGRFITACGRLETILHITLISWADIPEEYASRPLQDRDAPLRAQREEMLKLLIGEPHLSAMQNKLSAMFDVRSQHLKKQETLRRKVRKITATISYINGFRSLIAHKFCHVVDDKVYFHNALIARKANIDEALLSREEIENLAKLTNMTCETILELAHRPGDSLALLDASLSELDAFRDKCVPPVVHGNASKKSDQKQKSQHQSSRE